VFVAIEIKFPGDWVKIRQLEDYAHLMTPKSGANPRKTGKEKVALLRVPEDCIPSNLADEKRDGTPSKNKGKRK